MLKNEFENLFEIGIDNSIFVYNIKNKKILLRELLVNYCGDLVDLCSPDTEFVAADR